MSRKLDVLVVVGHEYVDRRKRGRINHEYRSRMGAYSAHTRLEAESREANDSHLTKDRLRLIVVGEGCKIIRTSSEACTQVSVPILLMQLSPPFPVSMQRLASPTDPNLAS